jgi:cell division septation protein DedD
MTDDRSRGVHLSDKQLVFVFIAATVVAGVAFLCGVRVGLGVQASRGPAAGATMTTPTQVVPEMGGAEAPVADATPPSGASAGAAGLKFSERLGKTPPAEQLKPPATAASEPPVPPEVPEDGGDEADAASGTGDFTVQVAAVKKRAEADAIATALKAKGYDAFVFVPDGADKMGVFRVRIGSFKTRREADNFALKFKREEKRTPWVTR